MTTKHRFRQKYRLEIREDDHQPPHIHLVGADVEVVISLETLAVTGEAPKALLVEALEWVAQHRDELMEEWKTWHD